MNPSVKVIEVSTRTMLCGSLDPKGLKGTVSEESVTSGTEGEARGSYLWDDVEE